jgi:hypothetical protein
MACAEGLFGVGADMGIVAPAGGMVYGIVAPAGGMVYGIVAPGFTGMIGMPCAYEPDDKSSNRNIKTVFMVFPNIYYFYLKVLNK